MRGEADFTAARPTRDGDPRHVYHNYSIAIDATRQLFNGAPGIVAAWIDALALKRGDRVLHVGAALGYYSALMAHVVGESGRVVAVEVDPDLAREARENLVSIRSVDVRSGDATGPLRERFDAILRDDVLNKQLGQAMMRTPFSKLAHLRRHAHEPKASCWLHSERFCLTLD